MTDKFCLQLQSLLTGFRNAYKPLFPDVIYYTATPQQQENHELEKRLESLLADFADVQQMLSQALAATPSGA